MEIAGHADAGRVALHQPAEDAAGAAVAAALRALSIAHQRDAGPGVFDDAMRARGVEHDVWMRAEQNRPPGDPRDYDAVLVFGGAMHADQEERHPWLRDEKALLRELLDRGVPLLGVCLGSQLLAEAAGGSARRASAPEIGWHEVDVTPEGAETRCWERSLPGSRRSSGTATSSRCRPAPPLSRAATSACRPSASATRWASSSTPRSRRRTRRRGSTTTAPTRTPSGSASTQMRSGAGPASRSAPGTSSAAPSASASLTRRRYSGVT